MLCKLSSCPLLDMFASRRDEDMLPGKSMLLEMGKERDAVRNLKGPAVWNFRNSSCKTTCWPDPLRRPPAREWKGGEHVVAVA
jgi:hypothetical protein